MIYSTDQELINAIKTEHGASAATIDDVMDAAQMDRRSAYNLMKSWELKGMGQVTIGRGSQSTRISWMRDTSPSLGSVVGGKRNEQEYRFPLNENVVVRLTLPLDLTEAEARRISTFITALALSK